MQDFTTGPVAQQLYRFSRPILLANFLQMLMPLISSLWVGNLLDSTAFAAVTISTTVMTVVLAFVLGMNNATLTIFAQLKARKEDGQIRAYLSAFVILLLAMALLTTALGALLIEPLLRQLKAPAPLLDITTQFLLVNLYGILPLVGYSFIGTVLRAFGDSRTQLHFVLLAAVLNIVLTPLFISSLGLGLQGAAWAVVLAHLAAFLYSLLWLAGKYGQLSFALQRPQLSQSWTILRLGLPSGAQMIVIYAGMTVILSIVNGFGENTVAGFGAAQRLDTLILRPAVTLGIAVNAMAAQNIGIQNWPRIRQIVWAGLRFNLCVMLAIAALLFVLAEPLVRLFIQDPDSVAFGRSYLRTIAIFYPFIGLNFILNGVVRGAGAIFQVLLLNILSLWILRVPLTWLTSSLFGEQGIALGIGISFLISSLFSLAYYRWGGWRKKQLFTSG